MDDGYKAEIKCRYVGILGLQVSGEPAILINIFLPFERSGVFIKRYLCSQDFVDSVPFTVIKW